MSENRVEDYSDDYESDEGHIDTRKSNFSCNRPDPHLGCDLGIDVAG